MPQESITLDWFEYEIEVERVGRRSQGNCFDLECDDGRTWRAVITPQGDLETIEMSWRDGEPADLDKPEWLEDCVARLARLA